MRDFLEDMQYPGMEEVRSAFAVPFSDYVEDVVLPADTLVRIKIPSRAKIVLFSFDGDFRAKLGVVTTTFILPGPTTADGSGSELNPAARRIQTKFPDDATTPTHICLRSKLGCVGSLSFYAS